MIRTRLRYHRPATLSEASALLAEHHGNAAVLGGGSQLLPAMTRDEVRVEHVVDLQDLGLDRIRRTGGRVEVGARVTYADVLRDDDLARDVPLLPTMARGVTGGRQLTQQATLVGSACHNHPGSDVPGVLVALGATLRVHGTTGTREVAAAQFLRGAHAVDLAAGEFVTSFRVDRLGAAGYVKLKHSSGSWPIATATALHDGTGFSVTLGAVEAVPVRVTLETPDELPARVAAAITSPWADVLAPASYRAAVAGVVAERALTDLMEADP
jgi:aerobic carbon-monoxide dehydrogenase medium subunit